MNDRPTPRIIKTTEEHLREALEHKAVNTINQESKWRRRIAGDEGHYVNLAGEQYIGFVSTQLAHEMADEIESVGMNKWEEISSRLAYRLVVLLGSQEVILGKTNGLQMSKDASIAVLSEWKHIGGVMPRFQVENSQQEGS